MNIRSVHIHCIFSITLLLSACLESGGGSTFADSGGIHGTGVQVGPIDAFGSVYVNGMRYETNSAVFLINGQPATQDDLEVGQVIRLEANYPGNSATQVDYVETVKGPVQSINLANNTFVALGQTVQVTPTTIFEAVTLATLLVGDVVEVSGFRDPNKVIRSTYIEKEANVLNYQVTGNIENLAATTFNIAGLTVVHNNVNKQNGQLVDVIGLANDFNVNTLIASEVRAGFAANPEVGEEVGVHGIITNFTSVALFEVNGLVVVSDANTEIEGGALADLALGVRVEVEGVYTSDENLLAEKIEIEEEGDGSIELRSVVEAIDAANNTVTLLNTTFSVNNSTRYKDEREPKVRNFKLVDIAVGDDLSVNAVIRDATPAITKIERKKNEEVVELKGPVTEINAPASFKILDFEILPAAGTVNFNQLAVEKIVEVKWEGPLGTTIPPKEIEIEN
jgi:hypothetical protein